MAWAATLPYIAGGLSTVAGLVGGSNANSANASMASKSMEWEQMMSNTAYRRTMHDMYKAGLNPILAAKLGGASTPPGTTGAPQVNSAPSAIAAGVQAAQTAADIGNTLADTAKKQAEKSNIEANTSYTQGPQTEVAISQALNNTSSAQLSNQQKENLRQQVPLIAAQVNTEVAKATNLQSNTRSIDFDNVGKSITAKLYSDFPLLKDMDVVGQNALLKTVTDLLAKRFIPGAPINYNRTYNWSNQSPSDPVQSNPDLNPAR